MKQHIKEYDKNKNKEMVNDDYGYKYKPHKYGGIQVKYEEVMKMLDKKQIRLMGRYPNDDYDEGIDTNLKTLIENVGFTKIDMFGRQYRVSLNKVIQTIEEVYYEKGWDEIYDYEEVK